MSIRASAGDTYAYMHSNNVFGSAVPAACVCGIFVDSRFFLFHTYLSPRISSSRNLSCIHMTAFQKLVNGSSLTVFTNIQ